jgi:hypothetical protein
MTQPAAPGGIVCQAGDCKNNVSVALSVVTVRSLIRGGCGGARSSRVKPARPYICLLIILVLVLTPSVLARLPQPFTPQDQDADYRWQLSVYQVK